MNVPKLRGMLLVTLGLIAAVGPLATDMYLPAFTSITRDLDANASQVQLTLTSFMIGMGLGQLVLGPLSDAYGRKKVLLGALAAFAVASIALIFTPNVWVFVALRGLQGLTGTAGVVLSRAIIADVAKGAAAVKALSLLMLLVGVGPLVAPLLGGVTSNTLGWRAVLAILAVFAVLMFVFSAAFIPETLPTGQRDPGGLRTARKNFVKLATSGAFMMYVLAIAGGFGALFSYISASPFVGQNLLGMNQISYSFAFALSALAMVSANTVNAKLAGRVQPERVLFLAAVCIVFAATLLITLTFTGWLTAWNFIAASFLLAGGTALILPNAQALALAGAGSARGSGSALLGAGQFLAAAIVSPIVGAWGEHTATPMTIALFLCAATSAAAIFSIVRPWNGKTRIPR